MFIIPLLKYQKYQCLFFKKMRSVRSPPSKSMMESADRDEILYTNVFPHFHKKSLKTCSGNIKLCVLLSIFLSFFHFYHLKSNTCHSIIIEVLEIVIIYFKHTNVQLLTNIRMRKTINHLVQKITI